MLAWGTDRMTAERMAGCFVPEIAGNLTTASPFFARLAALDRKRSSLRISLGRLAAAAGVGERTVRYALAGITAIRPSTLRKLEAAYERLVRAPAADPAFARATYRGLLVALAHEAGIPPASVVNADPRHERGPIARARMRAFYLLVTEWDLSMTAVGAIAGVTKQAVSKSIRAIEDERDDPELDAMLDRIARQIRGT